MYVISKIVTWVATTSSQTSWRTKRAETELQQTFTNLNGYSDNTLSVAPGATDVIPLGDIDTVTMVEIDVSGAVTVTLNGTIVIPIAPLRTGARAWLHLHTPVTSLSITNPGGTVVTGSYLLLGDPA